MKKPYLDYPYLIAIDNIQDIDYSLIEFLKHIVCELEYMSAKFILVLGTNTEIIPNYNINDIRLFLDLLDNFSDDYHRSYLLKDMAKEDAETLYMHSLKNLEQNADFLNNMVRKAGTRPFDIIMHIKYMQEEKLIKWLGNDSWYIDDYEKFDKFIMGIPVKSEKLIEKRIRIQKNLYSDDVWSKFKNLIKSIIYFKDCFPIEFVEKLQIDEDLLQQFMDSLLLRFDEINPEIHFYHHNIYLHLKKIKVYNYDKKLAQKILTWLEDSSEYKSVMFQCLIDIGDYKKAKIIGLKNLTDSINFYNYNAVIGIADLLLKNPNFELSPKEFFKIKYMKADSYRERLDHEKGAENYWELFEYTQTNSSIFETENEQYQFFHSAVNANLNSDHPDKAVIILNAFEKLDVKNLFYEFIILDRYAVSYLALGNLEESKKKIDQALCIAKKEADTEWLGIIYSDMAYYYYRGMQDANMAKLYFNQAYDCQFHDSLDSTRKGELLQQKAFADLLANDITSAMEMVNTSIRVCQKINCTYLEVKAVNLKGIIEMYHNHFDDALSIWINGIYQCNQIKNLVSQIRIYTNIGAAYLSTGQSKYIKKAEEHLLIAIELLKQNHFSSLYYKELFFNLIRLYDLQDKQQEINQVLKKWNFIQLHEFYQYFLEVKDNNKQDYGVMFYQGINFIF